jgi:hypothetical protein
VRRTGVADLLVPFVVIGLSVYVLLRLAYESIPPLQYVVPLPLAALAVAELVAARRVRAAVRHDPDAKAMTAFAIARCVALGKASSLVGAGVVGAAAALLVRVAPDAHTIKAAANDTRVAALLAVSALLLTGAGLLLERAGIDPNREDGDRPGAPESRY